MRAYLLRELGRITDARGAFERALSLANTAAEADHIRVQLAELGKTGEASAA